MTDALVSDVRLALRNLFRRPAFLVVAVVPLALGIGATSAIFSVLNGVLLERLDYPSPGRLMRFVSNQSPPDIADMREQIEGFEAVGGYSLWDFDLTADERPERISGAIVTSGLLAALGLEAEEGRLFGASDHRLGAERTAVVSNGFRNRLAPGNELVGRHLYLNGNAYTVIGVLPEDFRLPTSAADILVPLEAEYPVVADVRGAHFLRTIGRLGPEVSRQATQEELDALALLLAQAYPEENTGLNLSIVPLEEFLVQDVRTLLWILFGAVALVLIIACANVANLLLSRFLTRDREIAVRTALGASRGRLMLHLMMESLMLALIGGGAGLLLAIWGVDLLLGLGGPELPRAEGIAVDRTVLLFTLGAALVTGVVSGLLPAAVTSFRGPGGLRSGRRSMTAGRSRHRLRNALVVLEVTLALVLVIGGGLLIRSFQSLMAVEPGFERNNLLTLRLTLPEARYPAVPDQNVFVERLLENLRTLPGVLRATVVSDLPGDDAGINHDASYSGAEGIEPGQEPDAWARDVSPEFFSAFGIEALEGRLLEEGDGREAPPVAVVNRSLAEAFWPGASAVGQRIRWARQQPPQWMTVVGVVEDVRYRGLDRHEGIAVYAPISQKTMSWKRWMHVAVQTQGPPDAFLERVQEAVWAADPALPTTQVRTMEEVLRATLAERRFALLLLNLFAFVALVLAAVGVYGVLAYSVARRTREIGIRMALGADRRRILRQVLLRGMSLVGLALVLGVALALGLGRSLESLLFGVRSSDPWAIGGASLVLSAVAFLACLLPARRATAIEAASALRDD